MPVIREDIPLLQEDIEKELGSLENRESLVLMAYSMKCLSPEAPN
jgi:hypothetical protein